MQTPENFEGLTGDEMLNHSSNADLKAVVEKRSQMNKLISTYAKILSMMAAHIDFDKLTPEEREEHWELVQELRDLHCAIDPVFENLIPNVPKKPEPPQNE